MNRMHRTSPTVPFALGLMALEPRWMFDGAGAVEAADHFVGDAVPDAPVTVADRTEVAFVDSGVEGWKSLVADLAPGIEVVILDTNRDGFDQMAEWAQAHDGYAAIHILGHGTEGELTLGTGSVAAEDIDAHADAIAALGRSLTEEGDILIYGCSVGAGDAGDAFISSFARLSAADVAASDDATGSAARGGDWELETAVGTIDTVALASDTFGGILASGTASVTVSVTYGGTTYTDDHGTEAGDVDASYTSTTEGHITHYGQDGGGTYHGVYHPTVPDPCTASITVTPDGLQDGQKWYFYYDDSTVAGYPVRNSTGGAGSGTTLITGTGNAPVTVTGVGLDGTYTEYLFYVDAVPDANTAPTIQNLSDTTTATENGSAVILDSNVTLTDTEMAAANGGVGNYSGAQITIARSGGANADDVFAITTSGASFTLSGGNLRYGGETFATYTSVDGTLSISFSGVEVVPTQTLVNDVLRHITYANASDSPPASATLTWQVSDGTDGATADKTVAITPVADTPSVTDATTNEDTQSTSGLVISRNAVDGAEVTHFKITGIIGGTLYKSDGTTVISNGDFITYSEGQAGLKFTPSTNSTANGSFDVRASTAANDAGLGGATDTATVTVNAVADTPSVTNATTNEDTQATSGLVISRNAADGAEVTHFKITGISGGTLYKSDGTTVISNGDFITYSEGQAGLKFTPSTNSTANGSFDVRASTAANDAGLGGSTDTATITVNAVADTPSVTNATTNEDTQSVSGLVISRNAVDGAEVTHFKITGIIGGTLYKSDGTTVISNGDFITYAEGQAGLKFSPTANSTANGSFNVQASTSNADAGLGGSTATATVTVNAIADTPSVTNATTTEDTQSTSGLVIGRNAVDGTEVTHFKITGISGGTLYKNDGTTVISNGDFITYAEGQAGLKFSPTANSSTNGRFDVRASTSNGDAGLGGSTATATVTVNAVADTPSVTNATTNEDTQSTSGLVIGRNAVDGAEVTHFKITGISGGTLYKNDGTTVISNGDFITYSEGQAGLKFTPSTNSTANGSFDVRASTAANDAGLGGATDTATVTVNAVADTPSVTNATTNEDTQATSGLVISRNAADGAEVTHFKITGISGGTLYKSDGTTVISNGDFITYAEGQAGLKFSPTANSIANGSFDVRASTAANDAGLGGSINTATITVNAVADTPSVTETTTNEDTQSASGLVISRNAADGAEVTYFKITGITGGTLYKNDGTTVISNGDFITYAEGQAGLKFSPTANSIANGSFDVRASTAANDAGLGGSTDTATITVNAIADTPSVTNATTNEDTQSASGLVIGRNAVDGAEVTHFKITGISGGTLYKNDGTTAISNGDFITYAEGPAGLKFSPTANSIANGSFDVRASTAANDAGLGGSADTATVTVNAVADTPSVTDATTNEDTQSASGLVIGRNAVDGAEVTHFKITGISGGTLYKNDGTTVISSGDFITYAEGQAGLKFTPSTNSTADGRFDVRASTSNGDAGLGGSTATAIIHVNPVADSSGGGAPSIVAPVPTPPATNSVPTAVRIAASEADSAALATVVTEAAPSENAIGPLAEAADTMGTIVAGPIASVGFRVASVEAIPASAIHGEGLFATRTFEQVVPDRGAINFTLTPDTFVNTAGDSVVTLSAARIDGGPLPSWLYFNPNTGTFLGTLPQDFDGEVLVRVVARDSSGNEASVVIRLNAIGQEADLQGPETESPNMAVGHDPAPASGKPSFTDQLKMSGRYGRQAALPHPATAA